MRVRVPADKRFHRSHIKPSRRRTIWQQGCRLGRTVVILALVGYALHRATDFVLNASMLAIDKIEVEGLSRFSEGEFNALVNLLHGQNILTIDLSVWRNRLTASPWVKDVEFRRLLPSTIQIAVSEKMPVGFGRVGERLYLIDEDGVVIDEHGPQYGDFDLPIVDNLFVHLDHGQPVIDSARKKMHSRFIGALERRPELLRRVSQIDVADPDDVVVLLDGDGVHLHLGNLRFAERIHQYLEMVDVIREHVPEIDYVDLRYGNRVYVGPSESNSLSPTVP